MTRGRVVTGDPAISKRVASALETIMSAKRDLPKITRDVADMRALIEKEKPPKGRYDFKLMPGGLIDLEFIAQSAAMTGGSDGPRSTSTEAILATLNDPRLSLGQREILVSAHRLFSALTQILRLCLNNDPGEDELNETLLEIMCRAADMPDEATLAAHVKNTAGQVRKIFNLLFRETRRKA
jgi:[glutamine synthetase] adenylyltransferase / [glutamine synthetase]-adenylyl-L-tyrosine phosphorylase